MKLKDLYEEVKHLYDNYSGHTEVWVDNSFEGVRYPLRAGFVYNPEHDCIDIDGS